MKNKKAKDFWEHLKSHKPKFTFERIVINDKGTDLNKSINFVCGLNGARKTYLLKQMANIISCGTYNFSIPVDLKLGIECRLNNKSILLNGCSIYEEYNEFIKNIDILYIDAYSILKIQSYFKQANIDDFFDSQEVINLSGKELKDLNDLCGKNYSNCICVNVDANSSDDIDSDYNITLPYYLYKVKENDIESEYYSITMGSGEFCLVYFYFLFKGIKDNSIVIIDEPESFITLNSQRKLMDLIASCIVKHKISFIIATHSPLVTQNAHSEMVYSLYYSNNNINLANSSVYSPEMYLGIEPVFYKKRLLIVEDKNAQYFLQCILDEYFVNEKRYIEINTCEGCGNIKNALLYNDLNNEYFRLGIFDGDVKSDNEVYGELRYENYLFLPCIDNIEEYFMNNIFNNAKALLLFAQKFKIDGAKCKLLLNKYNSCDPHDYYDNICNELMIKSEDIIRFIYDRCKELHSDEIDNFVNELRIKARFE